MFTAQAITRGANAALPQAKDWMKHIPASAGPATAAAGIPARKKRLLPWSAVIAIDVVLAAIFLGLFSLFYIMLPRDLSGDAVKLPAPSSVSSSKPSPSKGASASPQKSGAEASPSASASENAADANSWRVKFADKFTTGAVEKTDTSYKSANVSIKIDKVEKDDVTYYVADIYLADIKYFRTAYAAGKYQSAGGLHVDKIFAKTEGAILGINGDNSPENVGPIVRNGELHNAKVKMDVLVMNNDGSMETFSPKDFDIEKIKANGAWQMWTFGPMLLKDGQVMTDFNSGVNKTKPQDRHRLLRARALLLYRRGRAAIRIFHGVYHRGDV